MNRPQITNDEVNEVFKELHNLLHIRLEEHGRGKAVSAHESLGIITEEYHEVIDAVRSNDREYRRAEMLDLAVACIFGVISL